jgi:hypothetical protein
VQECAVNGAQVDTIEGQRALLGVIKPAGFAELEHQHVCDNIFKRIRTRKQQQ